MDSKLYLCQGIKLDKNYTNVVDYTVDKMLSLVYNMSVYESNNLNYIDYIAKTVKVDCPYSTAIECNYMAFQNPRHGNKWYFAFIDDVKYESPKQCTISFTIDVWSTFFEDWQQKPCFVVREHVNNDTIGRNTTQESVGLGDEYVVNSHLRDSYNRGNQRIIVAANIEPSDGQKVFGGTYQGVPTGFRYFSYEYSPRGIGQVAQHINLAQNNDGNINQLFMAPEWLAGDSVLMTDSVEPKIEQLGISRISSLDGYTPKNKKLLTYPYCYILLSNGQGQDAVLHQELWSLSNNEMKAQIEGCLTAGCSIRLIPINYNGDDHGNMYGINLGKFPQLCWATDPYVNWLTENGVNAVTKGIQAGTSLATGDIGGGISQILNFMNEERLAQMQPPQVNGNTNAGDVNWATKENCFHVYRMTIKQEYAKRIDDFFNRFGYQINETKIPNIKGRRYWNYIKIADQEIIGVGNVPSKYMEEINNICRAGTTIWHVQGNIGNYDLDNTIV